MIKKRYLFIFLIGLLFLTYLTEEKTRRDNDREGRVQQVMFNETEIGPLKLIKLPHITIEIKDSINQLTAVSSDQYKINDQVLEKLMRAFQAMRVIRVFSNDEMAQLLKLQNFEASQYRYELSFAQTSYEFVVGSKLSYDRSFYLLIKNLKDKTQKLVLAKDSRPLEGTFSEDEFETSERPYIDFLNLIMAQNQYFLDRQPFLRFSENLLSVTLRYANNIPFKIDFDNTKTFPEAYPSVGYQTKYFAEFLKKLTRFQTQEISKAVFSDLDLNKLDQLQTIDLSFIQFEKLYLYKLYFDQVSGKCFVHSLDTTPELFYRCDPRQVDLFMIGVQDFWQKSAITQSLKDMPKQIYFHSEQGNVELQRMGDRLEYRDQADKYVLNQKSFNILLTFLTHDSSRMISGLIPPTNGKKLFELKSESFDLTLYRSGRELIVTDKEKKVTFIYLLLDNDSIAKTFYEYFAKR